MNAIILTEDQATQLLAARGPNDIRVLEPRRLQDGRLILNADILDDPFFADPSRPWAAILTGEQVAIEPDQPQPVEVTTDVEQTVADSFARLRSGIVTLTEAELAEPIEDAAPLSDASAV
jgi:hypothetical protein